MAAAADSASVPHSAGTGRPRDPVPVRACDCHLHVYDPRFPATGPAPVATVADYRRLQARLGTSRAVLVQAKPHGTDPACLLDAIEQLGPDARGIAVLHPGVPERELFRLHAGGVRGLRFSLWNPADAVVDLSMVEPLAQAIAAFGWHVQIHMPADAIAAEATMLSRLPCPIVFDHMARLPPETGPDHPAFAVVARLVEAGRAWVKLSGAYLNTRSGRPDDADVSRTVRAFVELAPERLVWGSDWPHVTEREKPDDAALLDLLSGWTGNQATRDRILVDNPAALYGF